MNEFDSKCINKSLYYIFMHITVLDDFHANINPFEPDSSSLLIGSYRKVYPN